LISGSKSVLSQLKILKPLMKNIRIDSDLKLKYKSQF